MGLPGGFLRASWGFPGGFQGVLRGYLGIFWGLHLFDWTLQHSFGSFWGVTGEFLRSYCGVTGELLGSYRGVTGEFLGSSWGLHMGLLWSYTCLLTGFFWLLNHVIYLKLTKFLLECLLSQSLVMGSRTSFSVSQQLRPELSAKWIFSILSDLLFTRKTEKNVYFSILQMVVC